ncbi:MAG: tetratricopeptide repeat protein [Bacteroidales bacterium]|nr:tetratricopeptide repeat protein [Bacteroidales bacterium]
MRKCPGGLMVAVLLLISASVPAQSKKELNAMFVQAESHYLFEEYELANPLYLSILSYQPDNCNILYKAGYCYLNIPDEKEKAIEFLEKAVKNASHDAKSESFREKRAPLDAYFSLAQAYMVNNELEKAINTFQLFQKLVKESPMKGEMQNMEFVDQQIKACKNAIELMKTPVSLDKVKLPEDFSMGSVNDFPVISFDGNTIAYTERRGLSNAIFYSKRERGKWQPPVEITYEINAGEDCSTSSLNYDGTELFLYKDDMKDGNIYSSVFKDGKWSPIRRLGRNINTKFFESHACISPDGRRLYFTSNREDGNDLDIYVSEKEGNDWGVPKMLPKEINTTFNEDTPFITITDTILFFASEGHNSMGGYDIFKSVKRGDTWSNPENMGYPINSPGDDRFYSPFNNGENAYYSISTEYKKKEIFYLAFSGPAFDKIFTISGTVKMADTLTLPDASNRIYLVNLNTGDTIKRAYPKDVSGEYSLDAPAGKYRLSYTGVNYLTKEIDTLLDKNVSSDLITLNVVLEKVPAPVVYEKIDLSKATAAKDFDTTLVIKGVKVSDAAPADTEDENFLYYTVQVMALHNPVDISYFRYINDIKVLYNDVDKFYRYTTGRFATREEALARRAELIRKGYPNDIFIKKVTK